MNSPNYQQLRQKYHLAVAEKTRELRARRRLTQAELAAHLGISQGRLSQIERGDGSLTAEQFLVLLQLFNVGTGDFVPPAPDRRDELHNALARLGAKHLFENQRVLPDARRDELADVIRDVLVKPEARQLAALAPVLILHVDDVNLRKLLLDLRDAGLRRRFGWLLENVLVAVRAELAQPLERAWALRYRRAELVLEELLVHVPVAAGPEEAVRDLLDTHVRTAKGRREIEAEASEISRRWGIVTAFQPQDFAEALRAAR